MVYVLDTNILRELLFHFPKQGELFKKVWSSLESHIESGEIISVDECYNEAEKQFSNDSSVKQWLDQHKKMFLPPNNKESLFIAQVFQNAKFRESIHTKNILENRPSADVYLVAKAHKLQATIVTNEHYKPQSAQLPNLCEAFDIQVISYNDFMEIITNPTY